MPPKRLSAATSQSKELPFGILFVLLSAVFCDSSKWVVNEEEMWGLPGK